MMEIKLDTLKRKIEDEKCVLLLGSEICLTQDKTPFYKLMAENLKDKKEYVESYYENENLFLFKNENAKTDAYYEIVEELYQREYNEELYYKISQIPFHLIISISPDLFLPKTFEKFGLPYNFHYFQKDQTEQNIPEPSKNNPLIYNLFGSIDDQESLILDHDDLFDYLSAILGKNKLPQVVQNTLSNAKTLIFFGFDLNKWYIQLLLRLLNLSKDKDNFKSFALGTNANKRIEEFCLKHFNIIFISKNYMDFINKLYKNCEQSHMLKTVQPARSETDNDQKPEIFISYAWGETRETIVNEIYNSMIDKGYNVIRDKVSLAYKGNIKTFMQRIGKGKYVILVISDKYLKSENCMYEVMQIEKNKDMHDRIFPIVLKDSNIYDEITRLDYIQYWTEKKATLNEKIRGLTDLSYAEKAQRKLNEYADIRRIIDNFTDLIRNMNTLTPDMHRDENFESLIKAIDKKIAEDLSLPTKEEDK